MGSIKEEEITFVVQGPVKVLPKKHLTHEVLQRIRKHFPLSQIILSTDKGAATSNLEFDQLVESSPPFIPEIENDKSGHLMSANYQIVSTHHGLLNVKTKYAVKLRSDMMFYGRRILRILESVTNIRQNSRFKITNAPVIVLNWSTVNPLKALPLIHHPSDHLYAGLTDDLERIWSTPIYPKEYMRWFEFRDYPENAKHGGNLQRFRAEEWIWWNFVRKYSEFPYDNSYSYPIQAIEESINFMVSNLVVVNSRMINVKENPLSKRSLRTLVKMMSHREWLKMANSRGVEAHNLGFDFEGLILEFVWKTITKLKRENLLFKD